MIEKHSKNEDVLSSITRHYFIQISEVLLDDYDRNNFDTESYTKKLKSYFPGIKDLLVIYDETIWDPLEPEKYKNLVRISYNVWNEPYSMNTYSFYISFSGCKNAIRKHRLEQII